MSIISGIVALLKLIALFFSAKAEKDKEIKQKKEDALKEVNEGVKNRDPSRITSGFDRINRL